MRQGFPKYSSGARKGEAGVRLVSKIVSDEFGWIFKRNHQEHDFGIDGQVEVVADDNLVTGQIFAVQIKFGVSFFKEKNRWGYIYRGETKHFNYLSNYPTPVVIVICQPETKTCYWAHFDPTQTQKSSGGWKMTIPFENRLDSAKAELLQLVGPVVDQLSALQAYWIENKIITESEIVVYVLDDIDVRTKDTGHARAFFDRLRSTKELAAASQGKVELMFFGYDNDPRELFEIEEVRTYIAALDIALPDLFFFILTKEPAYALKVFAYCLCDASWVGARSTPSKPAQVTFDSKCLATFIESHWPGLNELTDWLGMSDEENKLIGYAILRCFDIDTDKLDRSLASASTESKVCGGES